MKIVGYLTDEGQRMVAEYQLNETEYTLTAAAAGSTETPLSSTYLYGNKQSLSFSSQTEDGSVTVKATLNMASASSSYFLTEIGLYAKQNGTSQKLFKVFKLAEALYIDNTQPHTLTFTFKDADLGGNPGNVELVPSDCVTHEELTATIQSLYVHDGTTVTVSVSSSTDFSNAIKSIPNIVNCDYEIKVDCDRVSGFTLENIAGGGRIILTNTYNSPSQCSIMGRISVKNCKVPLIIKGFEHVDNSDNGLETTYGENCTLIRYEGCNVGALYSSIDVFEMKNTRLEYKNTVFKASRGTGRAVADEGAFVKFDFTPTGDQTPQDMLASKYLRIECKNGSGVCLAGKLSDSNTSYMSYTMSGGSYKIGRSSENETSYIRIY